MERISLLKYKKKKKKKNLNSSISCENHGSTNLTMIVNLFCMSLNVTEFHLQL